MNLESFADRNALAESVAERIAREAENARTGGKRSPLVNENLFVPRFSRTPGSAVSQRVPLLL